MPGAAASFMPRRGGSSRRRGLAMSVTDGAPDERALVPADGQRAAGSTKEGIAEARGIFMARNPETKRRQLLRRSTSMFEKQCIRVGRSLSLVVLLLTPFADFAGAVFKPPTEIDNKWFPLAPGKQFTFEGQADLGDEEPRILPRIVVFTVTDMTKVISGVETLVILDQDFAIDEEGPAVSRRGRARLLRSGRGRCPRPPDEAGP